MDVTATQILNTGKKICFYMGARAVVVCSKALFNSIKFDDY